MTAGRASTDGAAYPGDCPSPLRSRLRRETAALHHALESRLDLLGPDLSMERYALVVRGLHGYHAALEPRLAALAETAPIAFPLRARAALLERDLLALGTPREAIAGAPRCTDLPTLSEPAHLAGCVYVIEGASLGGRVIARAIAGRLGLTAEHGCAFFASGGEDPARRWKFVLAWLDRLATGANADRIVASAGETFLTLGRWLARQGALR